MKPTIFRAPFRFPVLGAAMLIAGCAGTEPPESFVQASQTVEAAETNPDVRQHASVELDQAREALSRTRAAVREGAGQGRIDHLAYIAEQRGRIALERAEARAAENRVTQLGGEREQMRLEAERRRAAAAQLRAAEARQRAAEARSEVGQLKEKLSELETRQTDRGLVVTLGDILFDFDKATLRAGGRQQVARLADALEDFPDRQIAIEGHTDSIGSSEYNRRLSQRRADAVRRVLVGEGIDPARIETRGMGEDYPVATNDTAAGRQQNRRVDVIIENPERPSG